MIVLGMCGAWAHSTQHGAVADKSWCYCMQVAMVLPVVASNGRTAHAHVQTSQSAGLGIQVQLPNGQVIRVDPKQRQENDYLEQDEDEFGPKGRVIDADWREVR